ncbi:ketol-acid reductoisomerase [Arthrobacter sp. Hiyo8]|nr:ketol-acid reductoisomerase [Arthrobacter sp. Hiyo8]GAP59822.1 ketol-acid reductoisomerase [Arthrobacter sp. Hiyo1]
MCTLWLSDWAVPGPDRAVLGMFSARPSVSESHPIEATGRELRRLFSWVQSDDDYTEGTAAR